MDAPHPAAPADVLARDGRGHVHLDGNHVADCTTCRVAIARVVTELLIAADMARVHGDLDVILADLAGGGL